MQDVSISDLGVSAFRGSNATEGAQGVFLKLVDEQKIDSLYHYSSKGEGVSYEIVCIADKVVTVKLNPNGKVFANFGETKM